MAQGQYIRIYHVLRDEFPSVWKSDAQLAMFVRLLMIAEKWWPQWAPIGRRNGAYQSLVKSGLVIENKVADCFTIKGLDGERSLRSEHARRAVSRRWEYSENTRGLPSKEEKSKEEKSIGQSPEMGFRRQPLRPNLADIERQHAASLEDAIRKTREREAGK